MNKCMNKVVDDYMMTNRSSPIQGLDMLIGFMMFFDHQIRVYCSHSGLIYLVVEYEREVRYHNNDEY